jgi:hypothetical protein
MRIKGMWFCRTIGDVSVISVVIVFLAIGLISFGETTMASQSLSASSEVASDEYKPPQPSTGLSDWIQFKNGEWLKGEIKDLQDESFSFESDELDSLQLDWEDIHTVYSQKQHTCVFEDNTSVLGRIRIVGDNLTVTTQEGKKQYDRAYLRSIIPGGRSEWDFWSLKYTLGLTVRKGNTDQTDYSSFLKVQRRSPESRIRFEWRGTYGTFEGEETVNNQLANLRNDIFMNRRLYLTAPSVQYYRDKLQNIDYRLTPGLSLGYEIIDRGDIEWNAGIGGGYQYTRFDEVAPGEDSSIGGAAILGATDLTWELTEKLDFELQYNTTIGLDEDMGIDHHTLATLSFDVWRDLEFDVSLTWDRVGSPQPTPDGVKPDQDDISLYVGVGWEF